MGVDPPEYESDVSLAKMSRGVVIIDKFHSGLAHHSYILYSLS